MTFFDVRSGHHINRLTNLNSALYQTGYTISIFGNRDFLRKLEIAHAVRVQHEKTIVETYLTGGVANMKRHCDFLITC